MSYIVCLVSKYCYYYFAFVKSLTIKKILNVLVVQFAYLISILFRCPVIAGNPYVFTIEPTNRCDLSCPQCDKGRGLLTRKSGDMSYDTFCGIIDKICPYTIFLMLYFQGEPLLHPDIHRMIQYARLKSIFVVLNTNGNQISPLVAKRLVQADLNKIIVSVDAMQSDTYKIYRRGGELCKVLEGIRFLQQEKKSNKKKGFLIVAQYLAFLHNEKEIANKRKLKNHSGADKVSVKTAQILYSEEKRQWLPRKKNLNRYTKPIFIDRAKGCKRLWTTMTITFSGDVALCCYDKNLLNSYGNILKSNYDHLYRSQSLQTIRKAILKKSNYPMICNNCNG